MRSTNKEQVVLLILRISLGAFLLIWSIGKLIDPGHAIRIFLHFYRLSIPPDMAIAIGTAEAGLSVLILVGAWKRYSYGLGAILHLVSVASSWRMLMNPFPHPNDLFIAGIPVLAAFATLYVFRDHDVLWTLRRIKPVDVLIP